MSDERSTIDKLARYTKTNKKGNTKVVLKKKGKDRFALPVGMSVEDMQNYLPRFIDSMNKENFDERKNNRDGKSFAVPINYASLPSNTFNPKTTMDSEYNGDIGVAIVNEIIIHGRQTIEELIGSPGDLSKGKPYIQGHISGWERPLLVMIVNSLLKDNYLEWYKEKGGLVTLEGVDRIGRLQALGDKRTKEQIEKDELEAEKAKQVVVEGATSVSGAGSVTINTDKLTTISIDDLDEKLGISDPQEYVEEVEVIKDKVKLNPKIRFTGLES